MASRRVPFTTLMELQRVGDDEFASLALPWPPGRTTYGGHVLAQAVWAAAQTVQEGFVVHNMQCLFTLPGRHSKPFIYKVERVRDGRGYCARSVTVRQPDENGSVDKSVVCFITICSFKRAEEGTFEHQEERRLEEKYSSVLRGKRPQDHPPAPVVDVPWFLDHVKKNHVEDDFPGVDVRKVDMTSYNAVRPVLEYRQLQYYTTIGDLPEDPNLHACAHLYASDRNSLCLISNAFGIGDAFTSMGSVSHSVIFHVSADQMMIRNGRDEGWFCQEAWTERSGVGRASHNSKIWDAAGRHIATTWQDGMIRMGKDQDEGKWKTGKFEKASKI